MASRAWILHLVVEADPPLGVEAVPLAGHGEVLVRLSRSRTGRTGQGGAEGRDGGQAVRLHLLAAEAPTHPQALHGHLGAASAGTWATISWVSDGCWVLLCTKTWPPSVDVRQRAVGLEVEVLLARELGSPLKTWAESPEGGSTSPRSTVGCAPWNSSAATASLAADQRPGSG